MITTRDELYKTVLLSYMKDDVELNLSFFDFDVDMFTSDILKTYQLLQKDINGDIVFFPIVETPEKYVGNCAKFLSGLNQSEGYERYSSSGESLDFAWGDTPDMTGL